MSEDRIRIDVTDHVADVRLVRSDKHNALDGEMFLALDGAIERLRDEPGVRAVVLSGEGPSFCSGLDVASFLADDAPVSSTALLERRDGEIANLAQRVCLGWRELPVPVIAALHGNCLGGGLQIALGADVRIVAPDVRMSILEIRWGLVPDMGITQTLPPLTRLDVAKELTFTGRMLDGPEAVSSGLATRVADDPRAAAFDLAGEIASRSPDAIRAGKRLLNECGERSPADALLLESELQVRLMGSPNQLEAVRAGFAKEPGTFADVA